MKSSYSPRFIFLIDSRGIVDAHNDDSQRRHRNYAKTLFLRKSNYNFYVISAVENGKESEVSQNFRQNYIKCNKRLSLKYILSSVQVIRKTNSNSVILIAGDPWEAALSAYLAAIILKRIYKVQCLIQIQIHADITDDVWRNTNFTNRFRYHWASLSLKRANQIRVVTDKLKNGIVKDFSIKAERIIIAPVELNFPAENDLSFYKNRPRSIGFAGRFHKDRSVNEFVEYIRKLDPDRNNFNVVLAGDGELLNETLFKLSLILPPDRLEYCGNLPASEMQVFWSKIGVYVSLAKSESYGRSIREAAYLGVPILAAESNGFEILRELNIPWICDVNWEDSPEGLLHQVEIMFTIETDGAVREILQEEGETFSRTLLDSWINLLES